MSEIICSVLLPSRKRPEKCLRSIASIRDTSDAAAVEILVRVDDDDPKLGIYNQSKPADVQMIVGPHYGYNGVSLCYTELSAIAKGDWVLIWNDDMLMEGERWDGPLRNVPLRGYYAEPAIHQLGGSTYPNDPRSGAPWFVRDCWKTIGLDRIPEAADYNLTMALERKGWKPWFLPGVKLFHDRHEETHADDHS